MNTPAVKLSGHGSMVKRLAFSPGNEYLASGANGTLYLWKLSGDKAGIERETNFCDLAAVDKEVSLSQATVNKSTYVGRCGDHLPAGAVCTCNCVSGRYSPPKPKPSKAPTSGYSYCTCDQICTCVPVQVR